MCEVLLPDGTPHPSNSRAAIADDPDAWFGFEQEYFLYQDGVAARLPERGLSRRRRASTTPASATRTSATSHGRSSTSTSTSASRRASTIEGINAEVAKGQWEFQIFGKGAKRAADEIWIARYLMLRLCERYGVDVNFHPKPLGADVDWNGSGMHTNFSTKHMREVGGEEYFTALMSAFSRARAAHIAVLRPRERLAPDRPARDRRRSTSSRTASPIAARRSASRTASSRAATAAISRIAGRTRWLIPTASRVGFCKRSTSITAQALIEDAFAA